MKGVQICAANQCGPDEVAKASGATAINCSSYAQSQAAPVQVLNFTQGVSAPVAWATSGTSIVCGIPTVSTEGVSSGSSPVHIMWLKSDGSASCGQGCGCARACLRRGQREVSVPCVPHETHPQAEAGNTRQSSHSTIIGSPCPSSSYTALTTPPPPGV